MKVRLSDLIEFYFLAKKLRRMQEQAPVIEMVQVDRTVIDPIACIYNNAKEQLFRQIKSPLSMPIAHQGKAFYYDPVTASYVIDDPVDSTAIDCDIQPLAEWKGFPPT